MFPNNRHLTVALVLLAWVVTPSCQRTAQLKLEILTRKEDIGLRSGPAKMYAVRLKNDSLLPISVEGAALKGGYPASGIWYRYEIQRWDAGKRMWTTVVDVNPRGLPVDRLVTTTLWPGKSLDVTPWEATGARDAFRKGECARFALHLRLTGGKAVVFSTSFTPDPA